MKNITNYQELHEPVLVNEVITGLNLPKAPLNTQVHLKIKNKPKFLDLTLGAGGHSVEILKRAGFVYAIDSDEDMIEIARKILISACPADNPDDCFILTHGNFRDLDKIADNLNLSGVDGVLFDLGISSVHLANKFRGFSYDDPEAPLDMRIDRTTDVTASMLINALPKDKLIKLFEVVMPFNQARVLVNNIVRERINKPILKVGDLIRVLENKRIRTEKKKINLATLPFLALRIAVNSELENLMEALPKALKILKNGGRLLVISFHSGEDSLVKKYFKSEAIKNSGRIITKKPIVPTESELINNPRARSAKLRIFEKI